MNVPSRDNALRYVTEQQMERLSGWAKRKPVIALMGEFSSGKSTLLNMLVGQSILPMQVTATRLPPVWFQYGDQPAFWMDRDGQRHDVDLDDLASVPLKEARFIRIYAISEQLEKCDLIDTPGISDPNIPTDSWIDTIGYANSVLWCTHAGQAWRESERAQWEDLPARLREHSLLLVTRADKIVSKEDMKKIHRRLKRETGDLFGRHLFISLTLALKGRQDGGDSDLWARSGGEVFMKSFERILKVLKAKRNNQLRRYRVDGEETEAMQDDSGTTAEESRDNVSVLRPTRIRARGRSDRRERPNSEDAASRRKNMLSQAEGVGETNATTVDEEPVQEKPVHEAEASRDAPKPRYVLMKLEQIKDAAPESEAAVSDDDVTVGEDVSDDSAVTVDALEGEKQFLEDATHEFDAPEDDDTIEEPEGDVNEQEARAEDIKSVVATIAAVAEDEPDDYSAEAPIGETTDQEFDPSAAPSEIWQEILASQEIETMPQMIEAITLLLEQLDRKHFGTQAA